MESSKEMPSNEEILSGFSRLALEALPLVLDKKMVRHLLQSTFKRLDPVCHFCGAELQGKAKTSFLDGRRTRCAACGSRIMVWQGTPLHGSKLTPEQFYLVAVMNALKAGPEVIKSLVGISHSTELSWRKKLSGRNPVEGAGCNQ